MTKHEAIQALLATIGVVHEMHTAIHAATHGMGPGGLPQADLYAAMMPAGVDLEMFNRFNEIGLQAGLWETKGYLLVSLKEPKSAAQIEQLEQAFAKVESSVVS